MTEKFCLPEDENFTIKPFSPFTKLYFQVEEIVIQCGKLKLKLPQFWDLKDIEEIIFQFEDGEHHYKRVKGEEEFQE